MFPIDDQIWRQPEIKEIVRIIVIIILIAGKKRGGGDYGENYDNGYLALSSGDQVGFLAFIWGSE